MEHIKRQDCFDTLIGLKEKDLIKILRGVRCCGKDAVMLQYRDCWVMLEAGGKQLGFMNLEGFEMEDRLNGVSV